MTPLLVALGAAIGAPVRYLLARQFDAAIPWGTLAVNLFGSFGLGLLVGGAVSGSTLALLGTGFCGGLTTYSAFAVQSVHRGRRLGAAYVALTITGCLALAWLGYALQA